MSTERAERAEALRNDPKVLRRWAIYDWANSAYVTTTVAVVLPNYFASAVVGDQGLSVFGTVLRGDSLWGYLTGSWALLLFVISPILGAVADFSASKKAFMSVFAVGGGLFALALGVVPPSEPWVLIAVFVLAQVGFISANVFYDGFLPDLTTPETIDRVSSKGYAFGYAGGAIQLLISLALVTNAERLGLTGTTAARLAMSLAGLWWLGFGVWAIRGLEETGRARALPAAHRHRPKAVAYASVGVERTLITLRRLTGFPQLLLFLLAYMVYNDGVQTMNNMASAYATDALGLDLGIILVAFLVSQLTALPGALSFGRVAGRTGPKRAILITLVLWILASGSASQIPAGDGRAFVAVAVLAGFAQGGNQALSRSLFGSMIPEQASAEFYGFYSVFAKFSAIWGPLMFGLVTTLTDSPRYAILAIMAIFIVGFVLLSFVNVDAARRSKERWVFDEDGDW